MLLFWTLAVSVPALVFVAGLLFFRDRLGALFDRFAVSRGAAALLTVAAWLWTAYECDSIGIDVFDTILLKAQTGGLFVWFLAALLSYLTVIWMPKNLPVRALAGLFMLMPAEALKVTRLAVPEYGFSPVQLLVALIYVYAIVGMYGMFYPWRIEKAVRWLCRKR